MNKWHEVVKRISDDSIAREEQEAALFGYEVEATIKGLSKVSNLELLDLYEHHLSQGYSNVRKMRLKDVVTEAIRKELEKRLA